MKIKLLHPRMTHEHLGLLPMMLNDRDPRPLREQLHTGYLHGGGWHHFPGFTLTKLDHLTYPGDPPLVPLAEITTRLRQERVLFYDHAWVAVVNPDRSFEVCRMD